MEIGIVLLGKRGAGKSSSGNTLLGGKPFHTEPGSEGVTQACSMSSSTIDGHRIFVVDTPGWTDFSQTDSETIQKIYKCIEISDPGPHVLLFVLPIGRFTKEEDDTAKQILEVFGEEAIKHTMVLFTKGDDLEGKTIEEYLEDAHLGLKNIIRMCGGRYHVFNNRDKDNHEQVSILLKKIKDMVERNKGIFFTKTQEMVEKQTQLNIPTTIINEEWNIEMRDTDVCVKGRSKCREREEGKYHEDILRIESESEEEIEHRPYLDGDGEGTSAVYLNQAINNSKQEHTYLEHGEQSTSQTEKLENLRKELQRMELKLHETVRELQGSRKIVLKQKHEMNIKIYKLEKADLEQKIEIEYLKLKVETSEKQMQEAQ
ncbi:GTPase IMAP family member 7-like [Hoplias malabaricus]|uniref:GTPase IMAP family member 7-like n=1 Tax=Hoplias malabaricus TaxID=27720 RepID=UPI0034624E1D